MTERARHILQALRVTDGQLMSADEAHQREERLVAALERKIGDASLKRRQVQAVRSIRWAVVATSSVALAAALMLFLSRHPSDETGESVSATQSNDVASIDVHTGEVMVGREGAPARRSAKGWAQVRSGDYVQVPERAAGSLRLPSGAIGEIATASYLALTLSEARESLSLRSGTLALRVPKLAHGHTLSVITPHATVNVVGTRFRVWVTENGRATCVDLEEGRVSLDHDGASILLEAPSTWSSRVDECSRSVEGLPRPTAFHPSALPSDASSEPVVEDSRSQGPTLRTQETLPQRSTAAQLKRSAEVKAAPAEGRLPQENTSTEPTPKQDTSTLAEQNRLFSAAVRARQSGDHRGAAALLEQLTRHHPDTPLAEAARAERARLKLP